MMVMIMIGIRGGGGVSFVWISRLFFGERASCVLCTTVLGNMPWVLEHYSITVEDLEGLPNG